MKKEEDVFFVNVSGADELRKELLESSKEAVEVLKNHERIKSIITEKEKETENLRLNVKRISRLVSKLRSALPASSKLKDLKRKKGKEVREEKKFKGGLDALEKELSEIEAKLNAIS